MNEKIYMELTEELTNIAERSMRLRRICQYGQSGDYKIVAYGHAALRARGVPTREAFENEVLFQESMLPENLMI